MAKRQAKNKQHEVFGMYEVIDALWGVVYSAPRKQRKALANTLKAFAKDCPEEFLRAVGPQSPTLLRHLMTVVDSEPGTRPIRAGLRAQDGREGFVINDGLVTVDGRTGRVIAIRHYGDWWPDTQEEYALQDYLVRWEDDTHSLFYAGAIPGDQPIEKSMTLAKVYEWYRAEGSEGIERVVAQGAGASTDDSGANAQCKWD
jgi:hypothetical protein